MIQSARDKILEWLLKLIARIPLQIQIKSDYTSLIDLSDV